MLKSRKFINSRKLTIFDVLLRKKKDKRNCEDNNIDIDI